MRDRALRLDPSVVDWIAIYMRMMELIYRRADEFDVLHFHTDYFPLSLFSRQKTLFNIGELSTTTRHSVAIFDLRNETCQRCSRLCDASS